MEEEISYNAETDSVVMSTPISISVSDLRNGLAVAQANKASAEEQIAYYQNLLNAVPTE